MITKLVGIKDFRGNLAFYTKEALKKGVRFIVLKKNVPVLEVRAIDEKLFVFDKLAEEINEARDQVKKGEIYSQEEIMKEFGLL